MAGFAILPILLLVLLMTVLRWSAAVAGTVAAVAAATVAVVVFQFGETPADLAGPILEAAFTAATILWIIFPALSIHEYQTHTGATGVIGNWLSSISDSPAATALLLGWFFALFLEGASGFGTPVAILAPMLVALGVSPSRAVLTALLGHVVAVSFGAVGAPMVPLLEAGLLDERRLALEILLLHACLGWVMTLLVVRYAAVGPAIAGAAGANDATPMARRFALVAAVCFFGAAAVVAMLTGAELPALGGALLGGALFVAWLRRGPSASSRSGPGVTAVLMAGLPYIVLVVLILGSRLIGPLRTALRADRIEWTYGTGFGDVMLPFYHPGTMLMAAFLVTAVVHRSSPRLVGTSMVAAARRLPQVAIALVAVLTLARFMVHGGLIDALAVGVTTLFGRLWPLAVPLVGALGSFVTGSGTASNIIFANFQVAAADAVRMPHGLALAGQSVGSAIGNIIAPHNIVAGTATVGLVGREGETLASTVPICLGYVAAAGVLVLLLQTVLP
ncbi:lactate permease [Novosphingobium sp. PhB165]|uniref:L-lactate permease n=1 Tax=Novosphingobium sp. PhB165 TaxID=2485105 RepID=UPI0010E59B02|nr:L-lactate permease [Novosphingobium sp. PhB165]TCM21730.1 lactate permease [Novosphingobium sp. PhB165]